MYGIDRFCFVSVVVASLNLLAPINKISAQTSNPVPASILSTQLPASSKQPSASQLQPTPEDIGDAFMMHQRYQAAIEAYKKGAQDSVDLWNKLGIAYQMMFNLDEAAKCYRRSLILDPRNARTLNNLGTIYDTLRQYRQAEKMYRKALAVEPDNAMVQKNLGTDLLAQHKFAKGWEAYKRAISIDPQIFDKAPNPRVDNAAPVQDRGAMNYFMAKGCVRAGKTDKAIDYLRVALNEGYTNPQKIAGDSEFAGLKGLPAFEKLMAAQKLQ